MPPDGPDRSPHGCHPGIRFEQLRLELFTAFGARPGLRSGRDQQPAVDGVSVSDYIHDILADLCAEYPPSTASVPCHEDLFEACYVALKKKLSAASERSADRKGILERRSEEAPRPWREWDLAEHLQVQAMLDQFRVALYMRLGPDREAISLLALMLFSDIPYHSNEKFAARLQTSKTRIVNAKRRIRRHAAVLLASSPFNSVISRQSE